MARPRSEEARRKAIQAAQEVLAEQGIGGFTLDGVAKRSGVAKTTLYRHWGTGNVLLVDAIDHAIERLPTPNTGSIKGDLNELLRMFTEIANNEANRRLVLEIHSAVATDADLDAVHRSMVFERTRPLREIVSRAVDRGEIPAIDPEQASTFIEGPMLARMMKSAEPIRPDEIPPMIEFIARGLGVSA